MTRLVVSRKTTGIIAILLGAALVYFKFPKNDREETLLAEYPAADASRR